MLQGVAVARREALAASASMRSRVQYAMRLGIFSDIHANLEALSAVLEAYRTERIDVYYCLGDTVGYGGSPNECADLVREIAKKTILGNHDAAVSGRMDYSYYYEAARHALDAHAAMLSPRRTWRGSRACPTRRSSTTSTSSSATARPCASRSSSTSSRPSRRASASPSGTSIGHITLIGHSHLCKVFALTPTQRRGAARRSTSTSSRTRSTSSASARSASRATSTTARATRSTTPTKKRFEFKRIEYDIELAADKVLRARLERNFAHRLFIGV